jgi:hypothetical protein
VFQFALLLVLGTGVSRPGRVVVVRKTVLHGWPLPPVMAVSSFCRQHARVKHTLHPLVKYSILLLHLGVNAFALSTGSVTLASAATAVENAIIKIRNMASSFRLKGESLHAIRAARHPLPVTMASKIQWQAGSQTYLGAIQSRNP